MEKLNPKYIPHSKINNAYEDLTDKSVFQTINQFSDSMELLSRSVQEIENTKKGMEEKMNEIELISNKSISQEDFKSEFSNLDSRVQMLVIFD